MNTNTCPACGGPGQKHPDEDNFHCPNNWCDVKLFAPRTQPSPERKQEVRKMLVDIADNCNVRSYNGATPISAAEDEALRLAAQALG